MVTPKDRRKEFKKALIDAGLTARAFAEQQGITTYHLHMVVSGRRESDRLNAVIDRFIESHQPIAA